MESSAKSTLTLKAVRSIGRGFGLAILLLLLAGCATGGYGGGSGYPDQNGYPPGQSYPDDRYGSQSLTGTVEGVDLNGQRLILVAQSSGYGGGSRVDVFFDRNTRLYYQGRVQAIEGLERGDVVRVETAQSGGRLWARTIEVVQNVRDGYGGSQYGNELRGAVGYVDQRARVIELDRGGYGDSYGSNRGRVRYDERTVVEYRGAATARRTLNAATSCASRRGRSATTGWPNGSWWSAASASVDRERRAAGKPRFPGRPERICRDPGRCRGSAVIFREVPSGPLGVASG